MKYDGNVREMSQVEFMEKYNEQREDFAKWQREYEGRKKLIEYKKSQVFNMLKMLHDIFRCAYMGDKRGYEILVDEYRDMFQDAPELSNKILCELVSYVNEIDYDNVSDVMLPFDSGTFM